jgi:hypothetical protein
MNRLLVNKPKWRHVRHFSQNRFSSISFTQPGQEIVSAVCFGGGVKILAETYCLWPSAAYYLHSIF